MPSKAFVGVVLLLALVVLCSATTASFNNFAVFNGNWMGTGAYWNLISFTASIPTPTYLLSSIRIPNGSNQPQQITGYIRPHDVVNNRPGAQILGTLHSSSATTFPENTMIYPTSTFALANGTQYWLVFAFDVSAKDINMTYTDLPNQGAGHIVYRYGWSSNPVSFNIQNGGALIASIVMQPCDGTVTCPDVATGVGCGGLACAANQCGNIFDSCGGGLACGCSSSTQNCYGGSCCTPKTSSSCTAGVCGPQPDGCGGYYTCWCFPGAICSNQATGGTCCTPSTCAAGQCGILSAGCGINKNCGSCPAGQVCTGGSCCTPQTCNGRCGTVSDGCGGTLNCPACCVPSTSCGSTCGSVPDGCGGFHFCGCGIGTRCCDDNRCHSRCP